MANTKTFGEVAWCDEDIQNALDLYDYEATPEMVELVRKACDRGLEEAMIQAGWNYIYNVIDELDLPPRN